MNARKSKSLQDFEATHGAGKIAELKRQVEVERAKVEALAETQNTTTVKISSGDEFRFGLVGCTHFGSLYCNSKALEGFYAYVAGEGIDTIYHGGDVLDGHRVYRGQEFELRDVGLDQQIERFKKFKDCGIRTRFITGNHDQSFKTLAGVPVGKIISEAKGNQWEFLGEEQARVKFKTSAGNYELMLIHPGGGSSYALSYRPQKIVESLEGGTKPNMLAIAHYHKAEFMPSYRNVATIQTGTFQMQTPFMARQGLAAHVGGWIVNVKVGAKFNTVRAEFVAFYELAK
jgi:hypothetical protein